MAFVAWRFESKLRALRREAARSLGERQLRRYAHGILAVLAAVSTKPKNRTGKLHRLGTLKPFSFCFFADKGLQPHAGYLSKG